MAVTAIHNRACEGGRSPAPRATRRRDFHAPVGKHMHRGEPLFTILAETQGELAYSLAYATAHGDIVQIGGGR
jgi:hypothetical protein